MRYTLRLILILCCALPASAQHALTNSVFQSEYTYVYKIPDKVLLSLYKETRFRPDIFKTPVDSFLEESYEPPPGNYLYVSARGNMLKQEIKCVPTVYLYLRNGLAGYEPVIQNKKGEVVHDALVVKKGKVLMVTYEGVLHIFQIKQRHIQKGGSSYRKPAYQGYIAFSKPIYQPNDTVKFKAFISDIHGAIQVRLCTRDKRVDTILTTLAPYRNGGYAYAFTMREGMPLDESYMVVLEQNGEMVKTEDFRFEYYELQKIDLTVTANTYMHQRHEPVRLTIHTKDENDLPLLDARLKLTITPKGSYIYHGQQGFIPDTLWQQYITPAPGGTTLITLPDSIFPTAALTYEIRCQVWNSDNQSATEILEQEYTDADRQLAVQQEQDSIYINMLVAGQLSTDTGTVYIYDMRQQLVSATHVNIPAVLQTSPLAYEYVVQSGMQKKTLRPNLELPLRCNSRHTRDSVFFHVINPYQLPFWYTIYNKRSKVFAEGYARHLQWQHAAKATEDYFLKLHHIRHNEMTSQVFTAHYDIHQLYVDINAPDTIAPGQESDLQVVVTDQDGQPVADADVTAYGVSSKFRDTAPFMPVFNQPDYGPTGKQFESSSPERRDKELLLDYAYWQSRMRLDTNTWFRFINPTPIYRVDEPAIDSITQIAPYIFNKSDFFGSQIIYIDGVPIYFSQASQEEVYSFRTTPGMHQLQIRTDRMLVTYDSFAVHAGVKNFVSINPSVRAKGIRVEKRPAHLTKAEIAILNRYMVKLPAINTDKPFYLSQGDHLMVLNGRSEYIAGPLGAGPVTLTLADGSTQTFTPDSTHVPRYTNMQLQEYGYLHPLNDQVITAAVMAAAQTRKPFLHPRYGHHHPEDPGIGQLAIAWDSVVHHVPNYIVLRRYDDSSYTRICSGDERIIYGLDSGLYQLQLLYADRYLIRDSIPIKSGGINYSKIREENWQSGCLVNTLLIDVHTIRPDKITRTIKGTIVDRHGSPYSDATVLLAGTTRSATADMNGGFVLDVPDKGTLLIYSQEYDTLQLALNNHNDYYISLVMDAANKYDDFNYFAGNTFREPLFKKNIKIGLLEDSHGSSVVEAPPPPAMRKNFKDDAFWQPMLRTDTNGIAAFHTKFPDDITKWRVHALSMTGQQQSGMATRYIRSIRSVRANLALPAFALAGDSIQLIGSILNYTNDTIAISSTFLVNDSLSKTAQHLVVRSVIDTLPVLIPVTDSMHFKYMIPQDGEQRSMPVYPAGVATDTGFFAALHRDTSITYHPVLHTPVTIYAEASLLPVLQNEMQHIWRYKYLCNEQMASKLKAYLLQPLHHEKEITKLINRLQQARTNQLWGWWDNTPPSMWISLHVLEALEMAKTKGYKVKTDTSSMTKALLAQYRAGRITDSIGCRLVLAQLRSDSLLTGLRAHDLYDSLRLYTIAPQALLSRRQNTVFGNPYWKDIKHTLLVYRLLRQAGGYEDVLQQIRAYFLEQRRSGHWMNTYESSNIVATILPDLKEDSGRSTLTINGRTVDHFPYKATYADTAITISKKGGLPVYVSATQSYWQEAPTPKSNVFIVSSELDKPVMRAGEVATLMVTINANARAEYVLIEIPIPAGCSYANKLQGWMHHEVHREYRPDMVSIFCSLLEKGPHTFAVPLMPRYTGTYNLNPASAEMQYFPLFMGRTGMKKVSIR